MEPRIDHAQYIASWLKVLKDDKGAIFTASSKASEAATWLLAMTKLETCGVHDTPDFTMRLPRAAHEKAAAAAAAFVRR